MDWKEIESLGPFHWRIARQVNRSMKSDGEVFGSESILRSALADQSLQQVINVASLPGLVGSSLAMPDIHYGYGFCIGGVAAFPAEGGIVLPGGVGYDINCGVRLAATSIPVAEAERAVESLGYAILKRIPTGLTDRGHFALKKKEFQKILSRGAAEIVASFGGCEDDLERIESRGSLAFSDPGVVSDKAMERGLSQVGSLGSGNHFIEIQAVEEIYDQVAAARFGLQRGMTAIMIHTGSRGFGHQVATDYIELFRKRNLAQISLADPQLVYAAIDSSEGRRYLQAMNAAANFAWANRHLIQEEVVRIFETILRQGREGMGFRLVYDQAHNIAKFENHIRNGKKVNLLVHRKGATRAFPAGHPELPAVYRDVGQPVLLPGSMGTWSYVLKGTDAAMALSFGSSAHGAGRRMSRHQAIKFASGMDVRERLKAKRIHVFSLSGKGLKEEIPEAYKEIDEVVETTVGSGISSKVARLVPLAVIKG